MAREGKGSKAGGKHAKHAEPLPGASEEEKRAGKRTVEGAASHAVPAAGGDEPRAVASHAAHDAGNKDGQPASQGFSAFAYDEEGKPTDEEVPEYLYKSRRMRRILIVVIVVLVALLLVGGVLVFQLFQTVQNTASQQAQTASDSIDVAQTEEVVESSSTAKRTTVPDLVPLIGMTQDEAVKALEHGAQVSSSVDANEEGSSVKREVRVALTAEPADSRAGTPTVYLGLDDDDHVVRVGYSTSTSSLGYGSFSFADAIENVGVVEETLSEAGLDVAKGSVKLPADKMSYSTYASDGTTLTREQCSFEGDAAASNGKSYPWSAVLSYDYSLANTTGNLADTMRTIYIYIG